MAVEVHLNRLPGTGLLRWVLQQGVLQQRVDQMPLRMETWAVLLLR